MHQASDRLLTTAEVADRLNVSPATLVGWRYKRQGPPAIILSRRAVRYRESALQAWLAEHEAASDGAA